MIRLMSLVFCFSVGWVFGADSQKHALREEHPALSEQDIAVQRAATAVATALRKYVHETSRPVYTYHFVKKEDLKVDPLAPLDFEDARVKNHLKDWSKYFWNMSQPVDGRDTRGFYVATDPVASRSFGGDHWALWRVIIPNRTQILDLRTAEAEPVLMGASPNGELIRKAGCDTDSAKTYRHLLMKSFSVACRSIAIAALKQLGAEAILYPWQSVSFADGIDRPDGSFVILNTDKISPEHVAIFAFNTNPKGERTNERVYIAQMYREARIPKNHSGTASEFGNPKYQLWPELPQPAADTFHSWVKENLMDMGHPLWP